MIQEIKTINIDLAILKEVADILLHAFQAETVIKSVIILSEPSRRNLILRITLQNSSDSIPDSIILKQSTIEKSAEDDKEALGRFARDWAGLNFLNNLNTTTPIAPKFYGGSTQHRFILIEDLGTVHTSLVDPLIGQDKNAAEAALNRYVGSDGCIAW